MNYPIVAQNYIRNECRRITDKILIKRSLIAIKTKPRRRPKRSRRIPVKIFMKSLKRNLGYSRVLIWPLNYSSKSRQSLKNPGRISKESARGILKLLRENPDWIFEEPQGISVGLIE